VSEQGSQPNLYPSTSTLAGQQAATKSGKTRRRILEVLHERGSAGATLWEVARVLGVHDHVISGRFTELSKDLVIERTGERRNQHRRLPRLADEGALARRVARRRPAPQFLHWFATRRVVLRHELERVPAPRALRQLHPHDQLHPARVRAPGVRNTRIALARQQLLAVVQLLADLQRERITQQCRQVRSPLPRRVRRAADPPDVGRAAAVGVALVMRTF
jgi:hypothetical protein